MTTSHSTRVSPRAVGRKAPPRERVVNVNFDVSQPVTKALRALRDTGLFGVDCASGAEELLRRALLAPDIITFWSKP